MLRSYLHGTVFAASMYDTCTSCTVRSDLKPQSLRQAAASNMLLQTQDRVHGHCKDCFRVQSAVVMLHHL
jgi:hypothetical protein